MYPAIKLYANISVDQITRKHFFKTEILDAADLLAKREAP
jgi:hypothetical protein